MFRRKRVRSISFLLLFLASTWLLWDYAKWYRVRNFGAAVAIGQPVAEVNRALGRPSEEYRYTHENKAYTSRVYRSKLNWATPMEWADRLWIEAMKKPLSSTMDFDAEQTVVFQQCRVVENYSIDWINGPRTICGWPASAAVTFVGVPAFQARYFFLHHGLDKNTVLDLEQWLTKMQVELQKTADPAAGKKAKP